MKQSKGSAGKHETSSVSITKRQSDVLGFVKAYIAEHGFAPSIREICADLEFKSTRTANGHLRRLSQKGLIDITSGLDPTIKINDKHPENIVFFTGQDEPPSVGRGPNIRTTKTQRREILRATRSAALSGDMQAAIAFANLELADAIKHVMSANDKPMVIEDDNEVIEPTPIKKGGVSVTVKIQRIVFEESDFCVYQVRLKHQGQKDKGCTNMIVRGDHPKKRSVFYDVIGDWEAHPKYGQQLAVSEWRESKPVRKGMRLNKNDRDLLKKAKLHNE